MLLEQEKEQTRCSIVFTQTESSQEQSSERSLCAPSDSPAPCSQCQTSTPLSGYKPGALGWKAKCSPAHCSYFCLLTHLVVKACLKHKARFGTAGALSGSPEQQAEPQLALWQQIPAHTGACRAVGSGLGRSRTSGIYRKMHKGLWMVKPEGTTEEQQGGILWVRVETVWAAKEGGEYPDRKSVV